MIDPVAAPGMVADLALSTLGPIQQLGARLGQILGGELSRMRADAAFAATTGGAIHAPAMQADSLRAQHASVLGNTMIGLSTQTDFHSDGARSSAHHARQDEQHVDKRDKDRGRSYEYGGGGGGGDGDGEEEELSQAAFSAALQESLLQFKEMAAEAGYSGSPIAVALPARRWLDAHAPADSRRTAAADQAAKTTDALVLCLAFDGNLGEQRIVLGLLFRADCWVGSLEATWSPGNGNVMMDGCAVHVMQPVSMVSDVNVAELGIQSSTQGSEYPEQTIRGTRVKVEDTPEELQHWCWQAIQWTWH